MSCVAQDERCGSVARPVHAVPMGRAVAALLADEAAHLSARLTAAGYGAAVESWTRGPRPLPVTPRALRRALGWQRVHELAEIAELPSGEFLVRLARLLPQAVARLRRGAGAGSASA